MKRFGWNVQITCPEDSVTSMNSVTIQAQQDLEFANSADGVLFGSGIYTRDIAKDKQLLDRLRLNPEKQIIGAQCSGTLLLATLGLLNDVPACTDLTTKPWGDRCWHRSFKPAIHRQRQYRHRRWLHGITIPGHMGHRQTSWQKSRRRSHPLCRARRRKRSQYGA